jgi:hypothetical protein
MGSGSSSGKRMPFSLKLQRCSHPLAELAAFVDVNVVPSVEAVSIYIKDVSESWSAILMADEITESGRKIRGCELFSLVFTERFKSLNCGGYYDQLLNQACFKFSANHALTAMSFILNLGDKKKSYITRRLKSIGRDHLKRQVSSEVVDMFLNALLLAVGDRLGDKSNKELMVSWAGLLLFVSSGMRAGCEEGSATDLSLSSAREKYMSRLNAATAGDETPVEQVSWDDDVVAEVFVKNTCHDTVPLTRNSSDGTVLY